MSDTTQLIKERLDIVDFLKQYLELKPAGKNFKALCPFHREKTPSFIVSPDRQTWHCFGSCGEGGDIIKFLMKYENIEFYDALKILAEKAGVEIRGGGNRDFKSYNILYKVMEEAKNFFKDNLPKSQAANDYLKGRGLKEATVKEFELGLALGDSDALTRHLLKLGYNISDIEKAGLAVKTERGTYWDRFRSRLIFPIHNHFGKVAAFTGRILPGVDKQNFGKYVNSPETPIFKKSKILYGFYKTKNNIREIKSAVLVEGQMDFLMLWQDGVKNAVATSGTSLTEDHLKVLRRLADELVLSFDADEAGELAAERAIDLAGAHDFTVRLLVIDDDDLKDPADVVKDKPGMIKNLMEKSRSAMEYYFHKYIKGASTEVKSKKKNLRIVLSKIKKLASPIDRNYWLKELAALARIEENILAEEMEMLKDVNLPIRENASPREEIREKLSRREFISERLLGVMLHLNKDDLKLVEENLPYFPKNHLQAYKNLINGSDSARNDLSSDLMNAISLKFSLENQNFEVESLRKEMQNLLRELKVEYLKEKRQEISGLIHRLEQSGDEQKLQQALKEFNVISRELHNI